MRAVIVLLLIGAVLMGIYDGGDITAAVVIGMLLLSGICEGKPKKKTISRPAKLTAPATYRSR